MDRLSRAALTFALAACLAPLAGAQQQQGPARRPGSPPVGAEGGEVPIGPDTQLNVWVGRVGSTMITERDLRTEWEIARSFDPSLPAAAKPRETFEILRGIVIDHLWIMRAKELPRYAEVITRKTIEERSRGILPELWDRPDLPEPWREVLLRRGEAQIAKRAVMETTTELRRALSVLPADLREFYRRFPEKFERKEEVLMGRCVLTRGERSDSRSTMEQLRGTAINEGGLEAAVEQVGAGTFRAMGEWVVIEDSGLRPEILNFASEGRVGDVSPVFEGNSSFSLYEVLDRREASTVSFDEAAPQIRKLIQDSRYIQLANSFLVSDLFPNSDYEPLNLFEKEMRGL